MKTYKQFVKENKEKFDFDEYKDNDSFKDTINNKNDSNTYNNIDYSKLSKKELEELLNIALDTNDYDTAVKIQEYL